MDLWEIGAVGLFGLLVGSFLNVVIYRVPRGESIVAPGSRCTNCGHELSPLENVPVLAWIVLRARCRKCKSPISVRYPLVEVATAALFALAATRIDHWVELAAYVIAFAGLLALSVIDIDVQRVPVSVLYPTLAGTAVLLGVAAGLDDRWDDLGRAFIGAAIGFALLRVIHLVSPRSMGYGDVRLAILCGLVLGWYGLTYVIVGLYGAFVLGTVVGVMLIALGRGKFGKAIPFAPYLALGAVYVSLYGEPLADATQKLWGGS
jgi:leader peptidase (prepilin peptidase) / N-methyltransferase